MLTELLIMITNIVIIQSPTTISPQMVAWYCKDTLGFMTNKRHNTASHKALMIIMTLSLVTHPFVSAM